jgi:alpha-galactosidase
MTSGWGFARARQTVMERPLSIRGQVFARGVGTHADSDLTINLRGAATCFEAEVGIDDEARGDGVAVFSVWVDGVQKCKTALLTASDAPQPISVDLIGAQVMTLLVEDPVNQRNWSHADWGNAYIILAPRAMTQPEVDIMESAPVHLPTYADACPALHGPRVVGATPGHDFLFRIPATGDGPLSFAVERLPAGLRLDARSGIISGVLAQAGTTKVAVTVSGPAGLARRQLTIVGGRHQLALTPPMGWNSWNAWGTAVDDARVRAAADAFLTSGLAAYGYQFLNIDDGWEADARAEDGGIVSNEKFPAMRALADYVHSLGLKLGIYSSPGPRTCGGYLGSYGHEAQDARTFAAWGIDYLKHDYCSYGEVAPDESLAALQHPYRVMREALDAGGRDIVYSLCQYGMGDVWEWGAEVEGNLWRTTLDIVDSWSTMASIGFRQSHVGPYAQPGHWNDPDMLVVGHVGWGPHTHPSRLTPVEQVTHISLWALLAAPLLLGCDLSRLDDFTLALLTNHEVIEIDQDPLGRAATMVARRHPGEVWARPLFTGALAVGLFNGGRKAISLSVQWDELGLSGAQPVRDVWQRAELGVFDSYFTAQLPPHGCRLLIIGTPVRDEY